MAHLRVEEAGIGHNGRSFWEHHAPDSEGNLIFGHGMTEDQCMEDFDRKLAQKEIYNAKSPREKLTIILDNDGKDLLTGDLNRAVREIGKILLEE